MLTCSDACWRQLLLLLATSPPRVERVSYLDGVRTPSGDGVVTTVTVPHADQSAGHFTVAAEEMSRAGAHLRTNGLVRLAQVHTHPGSDVRHSKTDDSRAYSQRNGAVSIVLPWHATGDPRPTDGAVHVRDGDGWRRLDPQEASSFINLVPAVVDTRRTSASPTPGNDRDADDQNARAQTGRRWWSWTALWARVTRRR